MGVFGNTFGVIQNRGIRNLDSSIDFSLSGTGQNETDYVVRLHLHNGAEAGEPQTGDVFLDNKFENDFSNVSFYDGDTKLDHYVHSQGNHELIFGNLAYNNIQYGNRIWATRLPITNGLGYSDDNGQTWTTVLATGTYSALLFVSSEGYVFTHNDNKIYRSNLEYTEWTEVLDVNTAGVPATGAFTLPSGVVEDSVGNIYLGRYQGANNICIYKSIDSGSTWSQVYAQTAQQHVHGMFVDTKQTPEAIYAILDGAPGKIIKSVDAGANWTETGTLPTGSPYVQMCSTANYRFACGESYGVIRTSDDVTWQQVHFERASVAGLIENNGRIYISLDTYTSRYRRILYSDDEGDTWNTIWKDNYFSGSPGLNDGYQNLRHFNISGYTPYIMCAPRAYLTHNLTSARLFDRQTGKYSALVYVKIPNLPSDGITLKIKKEATSSVSVFNTTVSDSLIARYKCDEVSGNKLLDSSGNGYDTADGTGTFARNDYGLRFFGTLVPYILNTNRSTKIGYSGVTRFVIPGSGVVPTWNTGKNISFVFWAKLIIIENIGGNRFLITKGAATGAYFGIFVGLTGGFTFRYSNGTITTDRVVSASLTPNASKMIAFTLSNDTIPVVNVYSDGILVTTFTCDYAPVLNTSDWAIGARNSATPSFQAPVEIEDIQIVGKELTELEIRQLYEGRNLSLTEPEVIRS